MLSHDEVKSSLLEILRAGILNARAWGFAGDAKRAAEEADHIHNLPELLQNFRLDLLDHYLRCQLTNYLATRAENTGGAAALLVHRKQLEQFLVDSNFIRQD
jgi:hypothetical protein